MIAVIITCIARNLPKPVLAAAPALPALLAPPDAPAPGVEAGLKKPCIKLIVYFNIFSYE